MTDQITVNVEDLRAFHEAHEDDPSAEANEIRLALAEYDEAEQERLGQLVMIHHNDVDVISQYSTPYRWATTYRFPYYEAAPGTVEAFGTFLPHQTDHAFTPHPHDERVCGYALDAERTVHCNCPEWAHTPPAVPDWQTDPDVLVVEDRFGEQWGRHSAFAWMCFKMVRPVCAWQDLQDVRGPITPVGWRRDPDSIVIPKSELNDEPSEWWRHYAVGTFYPEVFRQVFAAIADALEADHA